MREKNEYKFSQYCVCRLNIKENEEGLNEKARRFKFEISFNFKQRLIFIKCFQHTVELEDACDEKALFTTRKRKGRKLDRESRRQRQRAHSLAILGWHTRLPSAQRAEK